MFCDGTTDTATLPLPTAITESPSPEVTKTKEESSTPVVTTVPPLPSATTLAPSLETTTLSNDVAREDRVWWKLLLNTIWTGGKPAFIIAEHVFAAFGVLVLLVIFLKRCSVNKSADNYVTETDSLINDQRRSWSGRRNQRTEEPFFTSVTKEFDFSKTTFSCFVANKRKTFQELRRLRNLDLWRYWNQIF
ncbi:unnamed protein product [Allacma fusca]|uniref:Uncharacterized protein n=1 Tax=Allacma fusca TaxID=39272 RepID=A0A8J2M5D5_9HEXA|nr:unnamed protein product [Allacma fusca]